MHPYIKHLLEDIQNAERQDEDTRGYPSPKTFEEEMERYVSGEGGRPISKLTGLKKESFPPSKQLTDEDMAMVLTAYDMMLFTWNTEVDWPEKMPIAARYNFLLKFVLNKKIVPMSAGTVHLDFCTGYAPNCNWGQFCSCKEFWDE